MKSVKIFLLCALLVPITLIAQHEHHSHAKAEKNKISLDNGKKWKADATTTAAIRAMQKIVSDFNASAAAKDLASYNQLGKSLRRELDDLMAKCSMTGKAHDELHKYLMPLMKNIYRLEGKNLKQAKEAVEKLERHLAQYENYFE